MEFSKENSELQKIIKKINIADERLEEAERFGFDKTKLIPIGNNETGELKEDTFLEKETKEVTFEEILKKSNT